MKSSSLWLGVFAAVLVSSVSSKGEGKKWKPNNKFDFIVVGAGAAGAAIAARLSENGLHQVALVEAGEGAPILATKAPYWGIGPLKGEYDWDYLSEIQPGSHLGYNVKACAIPRGKGLGGSTLINAMVYTRGNRRDYDHWASLGNDGWDFESVLPFFRKLEDYQVPLVKEEDRPYHNQGGPVTVTTPRYTTEITETFHQAAKELGLPDIDYNAGSQFGVTRPVFTIRNGTRLSTADAYLTDAQHRANLEIIVNALVTKVTLDDNKRATGVIFEKDGSLWKLEAKKEVVISGGSINSPHLLLLSGIGPKETLEKFNIPVVADVPGVGQNFQDHPSTMAIYFTIDDPFAGFKPNEASAETLEMWERQRQGPLTNPVRIEGVAFFNSKHNSDGEDYPDMELVTCQPPLPVADLPLDVARDVFTTKSNKNTITFFPIVLRPKSRGYITLKSSDPHQQTLIEPRVFSDKEDVKKLVDGVKMAFKMAETKAFKKLGLKYHGNKIAACENHEQLSDEYWECVIRQFTIVVYHPVGTCKMGPKADNMAVVDSRLRVRGVTGLRVADVSICPRIITGHTMVPAIMIGEKAAHMILEDLQTPHEEL